MSPSAKGLSSKEAEFLSALAAEGRQIFTIEEAYEYWQRDSSTRERLRPLVAKGWLERIQRGKYILVPLEAGPDRQWSEDAFVLAAHLVQPAAVAYWSALNFWNLTEQIPRTTYVQTTARQSTRHREALGMRFRLVTVVEKKFFGVKGTFVDDSPVAVTDAEIRRRARRDGVEPSVIELDWALGWALWALAASDHLRPRLLFKDGTCLRKCYCPGYRFSEDLDFTVTEWFGWDAFEASIREAFRAAGEASGIDFDAREPHVDLVDNEYGRETLNVRVYWRGPHLRRGRSA